MDNLRGDCDLYSPSTNVDLNCITQQIRAASFEERLDSSLVGAFHQRVSLVIDFIELKLI